MSTITNNSSHEVGEASNQTEVHRGSGKHLVPIGVFWDIENCCVPRGKSALALVQRIRERFFAGHKEVEFMCVCDISKESKAVIQELNSGQVTVVHISATSKNAADDKLRQSLRRFANAYHPPATVVLLSGDVNFTSELSDLRHRHKLCVILVHPLHVQRALLAAAHQHVSFEELTADLPDRTQQNNESPQELLVSNLPRGYDVKKVKMRLSQLADNCGGRVLNVAGTSALVKFPNSEAAARAKKRMDGEDVFRKKICVDFADKQEASSITAVSAAWGSPGSPRKVVNGRLAVEEGAGVNSRNRDGSKDRKNRRKRGHSKRRRAASEGDNRKQDSGNVQNQTEVTVLAAAAASQVTIVTSQNVTPEKSYKPRPIKAKQPSPAKCFQTPVRDSPVMRQSPRQQLGYHSPNMRRSPRQQVCYTSGFQYHQYRSSRSDTCLMPHMSAREVTETHSSREGSLDRQSVCSEGSISGDSQLGLREVAERFRPSSATTRSVAFMHQHLYTDQGRRLSAGSCRSWQQYDSDGAGSGGCGDTPPLPWRFQSPKPSSSPFEASRYSPNFRRTPGAKRPVSRPVSRASSISSGSRPNSACGFRSSPLFCYPGNDDMGSDIFQPISRTPSPMLSMADLGGTPGEDVFDNTAVELMVSNLDYNISAREWKKILYAEFQQQIQVHGVRIQTQPDNTNIGFVRVASVDDARYAISQFHRKKIGYKRIHVALMNQDFGSENANLRSEVIALLQEVTGHRLPLFKFIELFEKRYHRTMTVSELYRMRDTVEIEDQEMSGRIVGLTDNAAAAAAAAACGSASGYNSPCLPEMAEEVEVSTPCIELLEPPVCLIHCEKGSASYADALDASCLPNILLSLRHFAPQVHTLLQTHDGDMPLMSFPSCYAAEFGAFKITTEGGVMLEHLISCVPGVKIALSKCGIKKVQWAENKPPPTIEFGRFCTSPLMNQQLAQFSREVVDLLKHCPQCRIPFSKYIPAYHHHFGRQCRVADYGFTKLLELFESIPHVVQLVGGGSRRFVTLSHRAQVKHFTSDMLRVLKCQASRQISVLDLPILYNKVIGKPFDINDYGVCYIEDMLGEVAENTLVVNGGGEEMVISIPRRDQTAEEMERTKQFALEVIDLLKHSPQCRMPFSKFIPAYHHHFGKQCRVADYGFTKLLELFESIPHVLQILDEHDEKILCLTELELLKVLEEQVSALLKSCPGSELPVPDFLSSYMKYHGHSLRLPDYGVSSVVELMSKIPRVTKIDNRDGRLVITLVDHSYIQQVAHRVLLLLMDQSDGSMTVREMSMRYQQLFGVELSIAEVAEDLQEIVKISEPIGTGTIKLCALQMFARDTRSLLRQHQGKLALPQFETAYAQHFGVGLVPASYGYPSVVALLQAIPHVAMIRGRGHRRTVLLCQDFQGKLNQMVPARVDTMTSPDGNINTSHENKASTPSNDSGITEPRDDEDKELMLMSSHSKSPFEALMGPMPSNLPSPDIEPTAIPVSLSDLMRFDPSPPKFQDMLSSLSPEEKTGQKTPLVKTPVSEMLQFAAALLPMNLPPVPASAQNVTQVQQILHETSPLKCHSPMSQADTPVAQVSLEGATAYTPAQNRNMNASAPTPTADSTPVKTGPKQSTPEASSDGVSNRSLEGPTVSPLKGSPSPLKGSPTPLKGSPTPQTPTTPRRSRLAARFDIPLSPTPSDASN